jgi:hypothetical protein
MARADKRSPHAIAALCGDKWGAYAVADTPKEFLKLKQALEGFPLCPTCDKRMEAQ